MREIVRFTLNGSPVEVTAPDPTLTLLDWLRDGRRLTGTKEGCAEGDCGACTVMAVDPSGAVRAVNACIAFLPMMDGCAVMTVEGLAEDGKLAALQQAMVEEHGSQCGFCTPGIVMALHAHHAKGGRADGVSDALAGNLCRCTGYGPILRAGERACALPKPAVPAAPKTGASLGYTHHHLLNGPRSFFAPTSLGLLDRLTEEYPDAVILAGATDVGLWVTKQGRRIGMIISVMRVAELQAVTESGDAIEIGAAVRYADARAALGGLHPSLDGYVRRLGAAQVRDSGTVVGNIANGSPVGDMPPVLIALGATIRLRLGGRERETPLEDFFIAYGRQDRAAGEIVTHVRVPKPKAGVFVAAEKVSKRLEQDISVVSAGFVVEVVGGTVASARLAFGGMAGVPKRAAKAEAALAGQAWSEASVRAAMAALGEDFQPLSDWRGSAAYRLETARGLLLRFFQENSGDAASRVTELRSVAHG